MASTDSPSRPPDAPPPDAPEVYLLHLEAPIGGPRKYAGHYLGEASSLSRRLRQHGRAQGSKLLAHARSLGIAWRLVRWWPAPADDGARRNLERRLKARHGPRLCPLCNPRAAGNGTLRRIRVATVARPRPRRYGRYLAPGETVGGRTAPSTPWTLACPFLAPVTDATADDDRDADFWAGR
ncbi:MAG: hypothetical protein ACRDJN_12850 [Chloroflexota bacterium]